MGDVLAAIIRWLHIASVATLIGGMLYASVVMMGAATPVTMAGGPIELRCALGDPRGEAS